MNTTIPIAELSAGEASRDVSRESPPPASRLRILVAEDDELLRLLYAALLDRESYEVVTAENGRDALDRLSTESFDLLLTDRNMPVLDGVELIRTVREAGNRLPILMISGSLTNPPLPQDVAREISLALPKPVFAREILEGVALALNRSAPKMPASGLGIPLSRSIRQAIAA